MTVAVNSIWSFERPSPESEPLGYILLRFRVHHDSATGLYEGECVDLGVTSFDDSMEAALRSAMEATALYLETLDEQGQRERVFAERGIVVYPGDPGEELEVPVTAHPGEVVSAQRFSELTPA